MKFTLDARDRMLVPVLADLVRYELNDRLWNGNSGHQSWIARSRYAWITVRTDGSFDVSPYQGCMETEMLVAGFGRSKAKGYYVLQELTDTGLAKLVLEEINNQERAGIPIKGNRAALRWIKGNPETLG